MDEFVRDHAHPLGPAGRHGGVDAQPGRRRGADAGLPEAAHPPRPGTVPLAGQLHRDGPALPGHACCPRSRTTCTTARSTSRPSRSSAGAGAPRSTRRPRSRRAATARCRTSARAWRSWPTTARRIFDRLPRTRPQKEADVSAHRAKDAPSMSIAEANAALTAPGQLFEMEELDIRGVPTRTWKNAPPSLRAVLDMSLGHGDAIFLVYEDERTTFAEHYRIACTLAHRLQSTFGIAQGDRVAIIMRNLPEWVMAFWARHAGRRHRRAAQRVVERRGAALRPRGLRLQGGLRRHASGPSASGPSWAASPTSARSSWPTSTGPSRRRPLAVYEPAGRCGAGRRVAVRPRAGRPWTRPPRPPTSPSTRRTTPPSSTRRAPPVGPRARWARTATCAPT